MRWIFAIAMICFTTAATASTGGVHDPLYNPTNDCQEHETVSEQHFPYIVDGEYLDIWSIALFSQRGDPGADQILFYDLISFCMNGQQLRAAHYVVDHGDWQWTTVILFRDYGPEMQIVIALDFDEITGQGLYIENDALMLRRGHLEPDTMWWLGNF